MIQFIVARCATLVFLLTLLADMHAAWAQQPDERPVNFDREIRPILAKNCFKCHGPGENEAGLRLNTSADAFAKL
ncbi:MAG: c-type cytochrome domain-containing protein, partial [Pirellulales bacterium]